MFGTVQPTQFDFTFSLLGIPVRVSAWFWLAGVILGYSALENGVQFLLSWLLVLFVSILIHELGHALVARYFGYSPRILLYHFGGLAMFEPYFGFTKGKSIAISFAGPLAGFLFYGLVRVFEATAMPGLLRSLSEANAYLLFDVVFQLKYINLFWGLINLLPVLPLDGGQICREVCSSFSPRHGIGIALKIAIVFAGAAAVFFFSQGRTYSAMLFAMLCASNVSMLQEGRGRY